MYNFIYNSLTTSSGMQHICILVHTVVDSDNDPTMFSCPLAAHSKRMHTRKHNFLQFTKRKKKVQKESYPKDVSTTQGGELQDWVVLWNECLRDFWQNTFAPFLAKLQLQNYCEKLQSCLWHVCTVDAQSFASTSDLVLKLWKSVSNRHRNRPGTGPLTYHTRLCACTSDCRNKPGRLSLVAPYSTGIKKMLAMKA